MRDLPAPDDLALLPGHELQGAGKPYHLREGTTGPLDVPSDGPGGYALCQCGVTSGWRTSDAARQLWHEHHVRNGGRG